MAKAGITINSLQQQQQHGSSEQQKMLSAHPSLECVDSSNSGRNDISSSSISSISSSSRNNPNNYNYYNYNRRFEHTTQRDQMPRPSRRQPSIRYSMTSASQRNLLAQLLEAANEDGDDDTDDDTDQNATFAQDSDDQHSSNIPVQQLQQLQSPIMQPSSSPSPAAAAATATVTTLHSNFAGHAQIVGQMPSTGRRKSRGTMMNMMLQSDSTWSVQSTISELTLPSVFSEEDCHYDHHNDYHHHNDLIGDHEQSNAIDTDPTSKHSEALERRRQLLRRRFDDIVFMPPPETPTNLRWGNSSSSNNNNNNTTNTASINIQRPSTMTRPERQATRGRPSLVDDGDDNKILEARPRILGMPPSSVPMPMRRPSTDNDIFLMEQFKNLDMEKLATNTIPPTLTPATSESSASTNALSMACLPPPQPQRKQSGAINLESS